MCTLCFSKQIIKKEYPGSSKPGLDCHSLVIFPVGINNIVITEFTAEDWQRADTTQQISTPFSNGNELF